MEAVLPKKDKEAVTLSEVERDTMAKVAAIALVVISDSIVAPPIAIGTTC